MADLALTELTALGAVAAHRSFRAAAAELGLSPSSLSHMVASLERRLGVRLFNRTTRSVAVTEAGEQFLARIQPALREIAEAVETVNRFRDTPAGLLRLNSSEGGSVRILPIVLDFMAAYPEMRVDLVSEGRMIDIVAAGFDAGIRLAEAVPQDMVSVPLGIDEAMIVVGAPRYLAARGVPQAPADLFGHDCIRARLPSGAILRWEFEHQGEEIRIDPPGRLTLGSPELSQQAAGRRRPRFRQRPDRSGRAQVRPAATGATGLDPVLSRPEPVLPAPAPTLGRVASLHRPFPEGPPPVTPSGRRQDVDGPASDEVPGALAIGLHVRGDGMRLQRLRALPLLDHHEGVVAEAVRAALGIHRGAVFDAALLGMDLGDDLPEFLQQGGALPRLGGDQGDDMDHVETPWFCPILSP